MNIPRISMTISAPKDFWAGIMFLAFAAVGLLAARGYSLGTPGRMGPGYFPMLLATVLGGLGLVLVVRSFVIAGDALTRLHLLPLAIIALGLVISLIVVTVVTALASRESRPMEFAALALVLAAFSAGVFVYALRLPLPIWPAL
jgi:Tripartite tricarboxylate transporter TctB family